MAVKVIEYDTANPGDTSDLAVKLGRFRCPAMPTREC